MGSRSRIRWPNVAKLAAGCDRLRCALFGACRASSGALSRRRWSRTSGWRPSPPAREPRPRRRRRSGARAARRARPAARQAGGPERGRGGDADRRPSGPDGLRSQAGRRPAPVAACARLRRARPRLRPPTRAGPAARRPRRQLPRAAAPAAAPPARRPEPSSDSSTERADRKERCTDAKRASLDPGSARCWPRDRRAAWPSAPAARARRRLPRRGLQPGARRAATPTRPSSATRRHYRRRASCEAGGRGSIVSHERGRDAQGGPGGPGSSAAPERHRDLAAQRQCGGPSRRGQRPGAPAAGPAGR